jgi:hypothetical protein
VTAVVVVEYVSSPVCPMHAMIIDDQTSVTELLIRYRNIDPVSPAKFKLHTVPWLIISGFIHVECKVGSRGCGVECRMNLLHTCIAFGHGINTCTRGGRASGRSTYPIYAPRRISP